MSLSPFDIFTIKNILVTKYFTMDSIHLNILIIISIFTIISYGFRKNNFLYNSVFAIWGLLYDLLEVQKEPENQKYMPFFFTIFLLMFTTNILSRLPGLLPMTSLLKVSIPLNSLMIFYFFYASISRNGLHILDVFFNREMILPIRLLIGFIEIFSFLSKIFSFSMRLLANLTAGHILMWVIESFVATVPIYIKILPLSFLVLIYLMEY